MKGDYSLGLSETMFGVQKKFHKFNMDAEKSIGRTYIQTPELRSTLRGDIFLSIRNLHIFLFFGMTCFVSAPKECAYYSIHHKIRLSVTSIAWI
jgi:hypothetical protein